MDLADIAGQYATLYIVGRMYIVSYNGHQVQRIDPDNRHLRLRDLHGYMPLLAHMNNASTYSYLREGDGWVSVRENVLTYRYRKRTESARVS